ncbi:hypothetical protein [Paenibacillus sabinae]|nr:hypothetical protein [Paenibacillus sabinae]
MRSTAQFEEEVAALEGDAYSVLGEYAGARTPILMRHNVCGYDYTTPPGHFRAGRRCPACAGNLKKTTEQFKQEVFAAVVDEYTVSGEYKNAHTKITLRHSTCGRKYQASPHEFLGGNRCPYCASSRGELSIRAYLVDRGYTFTEQHKVADCRDKHPLPFDFSVCLKDYDILIEYDGEQHFRPVDFAGRGADWAERQHLATKRRDAIKTAYCMAHGIPLIRISYVDFDRIDVILDEALARYSTNTSEVAAA